jgi:hypothetical protein
MRLILALTLALFVSVPALAQNETVAGVPRAVTRDGLTVALVHTGNMEAFINAFVAGDASLPVTTRAVRGQPLTAVVIFQGCGAGADGKCNLTGHFTYVKPDGSVAGEIDGQLWSSPPARDERAIPSPSGPSLVIEPGDPIGTWTVRVRVTDNVRNVSVDTEAQISVDTPPTATPSN